MTNQIVSKLQCHIYQFLFPPCQCWKCHAVTCFIAHNLGCGCLSLEGWADLCWVSRSGKTTNIQLSVFWSPDLDNSKSGPHIFHAGNLKHSSDSDPAPVWAGWRWQLLLCNNGPVSASVSPLASHLLIDWELFWELLVLHQHTHHPLLVRFIIFW